MRRFAVVGVLVIAAAVLGTGRGLAATAPSWALMTTPALSGSIGSELYGVSCPSITACAAVGTYVTTSGNGTASFALAEWWNGTSWVVQSTPSPTNRAVLYGVSCASTTGCTAVGSYFNNSAVRVTLAELWDGSTWHVEPTPPPSGATYSQLYGVSCVSTTDCTAVGQYKRSVGGLVMLAEHWDGTSWTVQPTPSKAGYDLLAVSCASTSACTATGKHKHNGIPVTLAERWNGSVWATQPTPNPLGAQFSQLAGVSCASTTTCTAVGYYFGGVDLALAERWNGRIWAIQSTPTPGDESILFSVSCASITHCTAVGLYDDGSAEVTLAESWNGSTWSVQSTPNASGAYFDDLVGVSCSSTTVCTAVGGYSTTSGGGTLAERYS
jgi:hypothetical protein